MDNSGPDVLQPKAKTPQPQGEPRTNAWDHHEYMLPPKDISRASSAPPTQLLMMQDLQNFDARHDHDYTGQHQYIQHDPRLPPPPFNPSSQQPWQVWAPPPVTTGMSSKHRRFDIPSPMTPQPRTTDHFGFNNMPHEQEAVSAGGYFRPSASRMQSTNAWAKAELQSPVVMRPPGSLESPVNSTKSPHRRNFPDIAAKDLSSPTNVTSPNYSSASPSLHSHQHRPIPSSDFHNATGGGPLHVHTGITDKDPLGGAADDEESRMAALLDAALDSGRDDAVLNSTTLPLRAASTPPSRMNFGGSGRINDHGLLPHGTDIPPEVMYALRNMNLTEDELGYPSHSGPGLRKPLAMRNDKFYEHSGFQPSASQQAYPSNGNSSAYPPGSPTQREMEMLAALELQQHRARGGGYDANDHLSFLPHRPASAQGRFAGTGRLGVGAPPPGFTMDGFGGVGSLQVENYLSPAMMQALATISAAGNLTPQQIQQIQLQMALNTTRPQSAGPPTMPGRDSRLKHQQQQRRDFVSPTGGNFLNANSPRRGENNRSMEGNSPGSANGEASTRSPLLEEFRNSKNKKYELNEILGNIVEFSGDQHGSRFIQQKLETATDEEKQLVFDEILPHAFHLMTDVFGNYVIQKFFEHGNQEQKRLLASQMEGHVLTLALQMYGCRVVQKAFEHVLPDQQARLISELEGSVLKCVKDQNGNHVIQKAIERVPADHIRFIIDAFHGQVYTLATHPYGCRVIQRIFEHCSDNKIQPLLDELHRYAISLIQDQYGNYVIQHILERGQPDDKAFIISKVKGQVLIMSKHKFASNVVEKCVAFGSLADRQEFIDEVAITKADGTTPLFNMMKDQFANYVVQKMLDVASEQQRIMLVTRIKPQLPSLKKFTYGKHLISKVEKLVVQYGIE